MTTRNIENRQAICESTMDSSPPLSSEVIAEVMEDLKLDWFIEERYEYQRKLEHLWSPPNSIHPYHEMLELEYIQDPKNGGCKIPYINTWKEDLFYNKATVFYWTESATNSMVNRYGPVIIGSIWNTWSNALGRAPQWQLDEFFAVPVSVQEKYAKTIPGILKVHNYICAQIQNTVIENDEANTSTKKRQLWPDLRFFKLHPICEALIVVFDEYKPIAVKKHNDGYYHYDDVTQEQSIILVRTGYEKRLSAPIIFESLEKRALPLARREKLGSIDAIRVPLQVGVQFVANLLLREEAAFPESVIGGPRLLQEPDHPLTKWEREAQDYGEKRLARAQALGKIDQFTTVADIKKAVLVYRVDIDPQEFYAPYSFKLGWI